MSAVPLPAFGRFPNVNALIDELARQGMHPREIAAKLGIELPSMKTNAIGRRAIDRPAHAPVREPTAEFESLTKFRRRPGDSPFTGDLADRAARNAAIMAVYWQGFSGGHIAERLGMHPTYVRELICLNRCLVDNCQEPVANQNLRLCVEHGREPAG